MSAELEAAREIVLAEGDHAEKVFFANGRGVSIIRTEYSYGGRDGLFEVTVLDGGGWLIRQSVDDVLDVMKAVSELPAMLSEADRAQAQQRIERRKK